jgi:hypothetical protein
VARTDSRIILYAITGCVSALFCAVIISGVCYLSQLLILTDLMIVQAIRAIRHPERYGPRMVNGDIPGGSQSRARGLGRAILDTFPIVTFGTAQVDRDNSTYAGHKDVEAPADQSSRRPDDTLEMSGVMSRQLVQHPSQQMGETSETHMPAASTTAGTHGRESEYSAARVVPRVKPPHQPIASEASTSSARDADPLMPEAIGRETCPICIIDFQEGDELRVLPCEGKHRFHQACVDPWLLELSGSCPLCRQGKIYLSVDSMYFTLTPDRLPRS